MGNDSQYTELYFRNSHIGEDYDARIHNKFEVSIFGLEKYFLGKIFSGIQGKNKSYLDFACGTGRILAFVNECFTFSEYVGCDSSPAMIEVAKNKAVKGNVRFVVGDLSDNPNLLPQEHFDVVTAFRLIVNLESEFRTPLLKRLGYSIKPGGTLIINNHMNRYSFLGIAALFMHRVLGFPLKSDLRAFEEGRRRIINTMSEREARYVLKNAGFEIVGIVRFTFVPGHKNVILLPQRMLARLELLLSKIPLLNFFCKDQIYVCVKK